MSIYREYDIRGIYPNTLNEGIVEKIGYVLGKKYRGKYVAVGFDARIHSEPLFDALCSGLNSAGKCVLNMGMIPTPVSYYAQYLKYEGSDVLCSVMITGSHNAKAYNGLKITMNRAPFFGKEIYALEEAVQTIIDIPKASKNILHVDFLKEYCNYLVEHFYHLKGLQKKVVYDCGNAVADLALQPIFNALNIDAVGLFTEPDGTFPSHHPDPTIAKNLEVIQTKMAEDFDIGFAYDGDADRLAVLTPKHNIKADILALLLVEKIDNAKVIGDVKCSHILFEELTRRGIENSIYKTGHSNLKERIKTLHADLAVEVSGHIFFNDRYFGFDDAIYATFRVLELLQDGMNLDEKIEKLPQLFSTDELTINCREEEKFLIVDALKQLINSNGVKFDTIVSIVDIDGIRIQFEHGWVLVRASNTTPLIVTRFEAQSEYYLELYMNEINMLIETAKARLKERE